MLSEFLGIRYVGVRRPWELLGDATELAWKFRKYSRWRKVHVEDGDGQKLLEFAAELKQGIGIRTDLLGRVSEIMLNVQKWRIDKESLSADPPERKEFREIDTLVGAISRDHRVMGALLADLYHEIQPPSVDRAQLIFYCISLDRFLLSQSLPGYPEKGIKMADIGYLERVWPEMEKRTKILYRLVGLQAKQSGFVERDLGQVFLDLGLHGIAISSDVNISRSANHTPHADIRFVSAKKFELIRVYTIKGILRIELNLNHPLVKVLRQERLSKSVGMAIVASYARAMQDLAGSIETIESFNSYLQWKAMRP